MTDVLRLDYETRSTEELGGKMSVGVYNYATHPNTEPLMLAWKTKTIPLSIWKIWAGEPMPDLLRERLLDPQQIISAFNSTFERYITKFKIGIDIPVERWSDPQPSCRYLSLPGSLDEASEILGLAPEFAKDKRGEQLIQLFCKPKRRKKKDTGPVQYNDWNSHSAEWEEFVEYCKQDVRAEEEVERKLSLVGAFPLPDREKEIWYFDQHCNDRGIPVDLEFVQNAYDLAVRFKNEKQEEQNKLTGLENANSGSQLLPWLIAQGYKRGDIRKETVKTELEFNKELSLVAKEALQLRLSAGSTTYTKLAAVLRQICPDARLRNQFLYMGSARCGRWSGAGGIQFHNMSRPEPQFEDENIVNSARFLIRHKLYQDIIDSFGSVLLTVKNCVRTSFVADLGNRLDVADLNAIETRYGAWVAGCKSLLDVFVPRLGHPNGNDPYLDFASKMTGIPYEKLAADIKSKDPKVKAAAKRLRQMAKSAVLGCIYRLGGGKMGVNPQTGDPIRTGLWGYALGMGLDMTQDESHELVRVFRNTYPEIRKMWEDLEVAIKEVLQGERTVRHLGPNGCIKIDKLNIRQQYQDSLGSGENKWAILRIQLPSGRYLHYMNARIEDKIMDWVDDEGNECHKDTLFYDGLHQTTKQWVSLSSHGGKVFENIVQGGARDILAAKLLRIERELKMQICLHVHDEGGAEQPDRADVPNYTDMVRIMSEPEEDCPGLLLGADGFSDEFYHK